MPITITPLSGMPEVAPGDDLAGLIAAAAEDNGCTLTEGDVVVVAQKVVSKAEGMLRDLATVVPGERAVALARTLDADPRVVQVVLDESVRIVRADRILIVETHHGFVCANGGVDQSNVPGESVVTTLPRDCDASARELHEGIRRHTGVSTGVIIADSFGRPWRLGVVNVALGVAGMPALVDLRGSPDANGRELTVTITAVADEIAAAAELVMPKAAMTPVAVVRGADLGNAAAGTGRDLLRPADLDLFR